MRRRSKTRHDCAVEGLPPKVEQVTKRIWPTRAKQHQACWVKGAQRVCAAPVTNENALSAQRWPQSDTRRHDHNPVEGEQLDVGGRDSARSSSAAHTVDHQAVFGTKAAQWWPVARPTTRSARAFDLAREHIRPPRSQPIAPGCLICAASRKYAAQRDEGKLRKEDARATSKLVATMR